MVKTIGQLLLAGGLIYLALMLYLYLNQAKMIHLPDFPSRQISATPQQIGLEYERVELTTDDGVHLEGWFLPAQQPRATLLFFHGNAGNISHRLDSLQLFHELGLAVFIFDYRGYGNSEGKPTEAGIYRDAETAWRYLIEARGIPAHEILLFGRSFGGAVAAYLAERHEALGLVLESTFTSIPDLAAELYPWLPGRALARFHYDTRSRLPRIEMPVLVIHSPQDDIIPFSQGRELYELAREPKSLLQINGSHNTGVHESRHAYRKGWDEFIIHCNQHQEQSLRLQ
jgi:fermentation-respiration switch protein FrsA (DUF1100 family)